MVRRQAVWISVSLLASLSVLAAPKNRDWQNGKVIESERTRRADEGTSQAFVIEGTTHVYTAEKAIGDFNRRNPYPNLTVNGPVKFAIDKRNLFLIDEDGREHKLEITKRVLKVPTEQK